MNDPTELALRASVDAEIEKRAAVRRDYDLAKRGIVIHKPPTVANWLELPLLARAKYLQAHGPQLNQGE